MADSNSQDDRTGTKSYQFLGKMQALQEVSLELSRAANPEDLYRNAIELGCTRLGFNRLSLLLYDEDSNLMIGTFSADEQGNLRDERDCSQPITDPRLLEILHNQDRHSCWLETRFQGFDRAKGSGWNALAVLWSGEKGMGWLAADNLWEHTPSEDHQLDLLALYGATLGHLVTTRQLEEEFHSLAERRTRQIRLTTQVAQAIARATNLDDLYERVVTEVKEQFGYYHTQLLRYDVQIDAVKLVAGYGEIGRQMKEKGHAMPIGLGLIGTAAATGQPVLRPNLVHDSDWRPNPLLPDTKGEIAVPIKLGEAILGVLDVQSDVADALNADDQLLLEGLCGQIAIAIESTRLTSDLQDTTTFLDSVIENIPNMVFVKEAENLRFVRQNKAGLQMLGITLDEIIGKNDYDLFPPDEADFFISKDRQVLNSGSLLDIPEELLPTPDGVRFLHTRKVPLLDADGRPRYLLGLSEDITERKQAEEALRQERALLSSLLDSIPDLIFYKDVDGVYMGCNNAFAEFAGRSKADLVGKTDFDLFPSEVAAFFREQDKEMMEQGQARHNEEWVDYPDGRRVLLDTLKTPFYDSETNLLGLIGISRDITAIHQSQEELLRLGYVVEQSLDGTAVANMDGIIQFANPAWATMHGYEVEEVVGKHLSIFHTPEQLTQEVIPLNDTVLATGQTRQSEVGHLRQDGHTFPTLMTIGVLQDSSGTPIGLVATAQDITERKAFENTLRENQTRLAEAIGIAKLHYWEFDIATQQFAFLPEYYELLGTTVEEEGGLTMSAENYARKFVPAAESPIVETEIVAALTTKDPNYSREFDSLNLTTDGRIFPIRVRFRILKDPDGNTIKFIGANQDITDQVAAEQELRERESLLRTIIDSTPDWIFVKDKNHRYLLVNQGYANSFHIDPNDFIGKNDLEIGFPEDIVKGNPEKGIRGFWTDDREIMDRGEVKIIDVEPAVVDGKERFLNTIKAPLKDASGNVTGIVGFVNDITARILAEEKLGKQAAQLQTVAEISTSVSTTLEQTTLLENVVDLTKERFNLYHAHIYLLGAHGQSLALVAGAGETGRAMTAEGRHISLAQEKSLVARAARTRQGVIINDVQADPGFLPHPLLPNTRSEMAVPMLAGEKVIGVLDIQADQPNYFTDEDANIQTTLAAQIAIAVENSRLLTESQQAVTELDELTRRLTRESWESYLQGYKQPEKGYAYDFGGLRPLEETGMDFPLSAAQAGDPDNGLLSHSLTVHGEPIGRLALYQDTDEEVQTAVDIDEVEAIIAAVAEQLSARIENIRLTEQTQAALSLTERLYQAGHHINSAGGDLQGALAAINEAGAIPVINRAVLFLFEHNAEGDMQAIVSAANWYSGSGLKPTAVGTRYEREAMTALNLMVTRDTLLFDDAIQDERIDKVTQGIFKALNIQSLVVLPLWVGNRQLGSVLLEAEEVHHFIDSEIQPYITLSGQLAIAVDRQRLLNETQSRAERERQIRTITDKIRRGIDRDAILQIARDEISQMLGAKTAAGQLGTSALIVDRLHEQDAPPKPNGRQ